MKNMVSVSKEPMWKFKTVAANPNAFRGQVGNIDEGPGPGLGSRERWGLKPTGQVILHASGPAAQLLPLLLRGQGCASSLQEKWRPGFLCEVSRVLKACSLYNNTHAHTSTQIWNCPPPPSSFHLWFAQNLLYINHPASLSISPSVTPFLLWSFTQLYPSATFHTLPSSIHRTEKSHITHWRKHLMVLEF